MPISFRVGQRVRIKYSKGWPEISGCEGTVTSKLEESVNKYGNVYLGHCVAPDCWNTSKAPYKSIDGGDIFCPHPEQLEPLYDGYDKVSWESMKDLWTPQYETKLEAA